MTYGNVPQPYPSPSPERGCVVCALVIPTTGPNGAQTPAQVGQATASFVANEAGIAFVSPRGSYLDKLCVVRGCYCQQESVGHSVGES